VTARRIVISGRVQGVGYRDWMCARAEALGLSGWVRNRADGTVEALVHGDAGSIAILLRECREGPLLAAVRDIIEELTDPPGTTGFVRRPTA
jgi:acylphosphatase